MKSRIDLELRCKRDEACIATVLEYEGNIAKAKKNGFKFLECSAERREGSLSMNLMFELFDAYGYEYHASTTESVIFKRAPKMKHDELVAYNTFVEKGSDTTTTIINKG